MEGQNELTAEEAASYRAELAAEIWEGEPSPEIEQDNEPEQEAEVNDDPWSGVNPALKATFDEMQAKLASFDAMSQRLQSSEGRIGALQRELQQQRNAAEKAAEQVSHAPTSEQMAAAATNSQQWKELQEDFPEWANALESKNSEIRAELQREIAAIKAAIPQKDSTVDLDALRLEYDAKMLTLKFPDWRDTVSSPEYQTWIGTQPAEIQFKAVNSRDALECISILDSYTKANTTKSAAQIAAERKARLETAGTTVRGGSRAAPIKSVDDMTPEEYRAHIAKKIWSD